jgi:aminoglycoside 2'-N-acetyltransferase I
VAVRTFATAALRPAQERAIRDLLRAAFVDDGDGFAEEDWAHALGGLHAVAEVDGEIVAHAAVVARPLEIDGRPLRTGYVEAVGTAPARQGEGHGSAVMRAIGEAIAGEYELGALGTGAFAFYERLGWRRWAGRSAVRTDHGLVRTPDDDAWLMLLRTPASPPFEVTGLITCDWREGDVW